MSTLCSIFNSPDTIERSHISEGLQEYTVSSSKLDVGSLDYYLEKDPCPFISSSSFCGDYFVNSDAKIVELLHEEECFPSKDLMIGSLLIVLESMHSDSEFVQGTAKGGSMKNVLSLANYNDCSNEFDKI